jgi:uncharacterized protein YecE (DUF72 family)
VVKRVRSQQADLFGEPAAAAIAPAAVDNEMLSLGASMPSTLRLGTSSWAFPGWRGLVYATRESATRLSREGLAAYAQHPLLRTVGLDRTFYAPIAATEFAEYARVVPDEFRFLVKAHAAITTTDRQRAIGETTNTPVFLDSVYATERVIAPAVEGLGLKLGVLLFQFPPLALPSKRAAAFAEQLQRFLSELPRGVPYAVEIRDSSQLSMEYAQALREGGATHCYTVHPRMPSVLEQWHALGDVVREAGPVAVRWMLRTDQQYESAREEYAPFDQLVAPDITRRAEVAEVLQRLIADRKQTLVIANNKAEGSAPRTLTELARLIASQR